MNARAGLISIYTVHIEDDNGRYFAVTLPAISADDAENRVRYILADDTARIIGTVA